ncbi:hypothetical protein LIER_22395 [Lithospermum erythrorhizon]|uniref:Uncharacterized protein n=1 Tax=Lithospermum erythrorhizon TaxID=34254 RepID=A0AAV3QTP3_LITER
MKDFSHFTLCKFSLPSPKLFHHPKKLSFLFFTMACTKRTTKRVSPPARGKNLQGESSSPLPLLLPLLLHPLPSPMPYLLLGLEQMVIRPYTSKPGTSVRNRLKSASRWKCWSRSYRVSFFKPATTPRTWPSLDQELKRAQMERDAADQDALDTRRDKEGLRWAHLQENPLRCCRVGVAILSDFVLYSQDWSPTLPALTKEYTKLVVYWSSLGNRVQLILYLRRTC